MAKKRSRSGKPKQDWALWDRVAETIKPMDRTISPLARARARSLNSSAKAGESGEQTPLDTAQTNRAAMEAYLGTKAVAAPPRATPTAGSISEKVPGSGAGKAPFVKAEPKAPFLPSWQPPAQKATKMAKTQEPIDRKTKRKLSKGTLGVDARIDLHGMTQDEAHNALIGFIGMSYNRGHRMVLVITGKGLSKQGQGILRRAVPRWLVTPPLAHWVNGHDVAASQHGGDGALYVRLRRPPAKTGFSTP
ncbi:MAG: Smr/MutS family protein [Pseudomonadota bacterium]